MDVKANVSSLFARNIQGRMIYSITENLHKTSALFTAGGGFENTHYGCDSSGMTLTRPHVIGDQISIPNCSESIWVRPEIIKSPVAKTTSLVAIENEIASKPELIEFSVASAKNEEVIEFTVPGATEWTKTFSRIPGNPNDLSPPQKQLLLVKTSSGKDNGVPANKLVKPLIHFSTRKQSD